MQGYSLFSQCRQYLDWRQTCPLATNSYLRHHGLLPVQTWLPTVLNGVCDAGGFTCSFLPRFHKSCRPISCHEHSPSIVSHDFIQLSHLTDPGLKPSFPPVPSFPLSSPNQAQFLEIRFLFLEVIQIFPSKLQSISQRTHCSTFSSGAVPAVFLKRLHSFVFF